MKLHEVGAAAVLLQAHRAGVARDAVVGVHHQVAQLQVVEVGGENSEAPAPGLLLVDLAEDFPLGHDEEAGAGQDEARLQASRKDESGCRRGRRDRRIFPEGGRFSQLAKDLAETFHPPVAAHRDEGLPAIGCGGSQVGREIRKPLHVIPGRAAGDVCLFFTGSQGKLRDQQRRAAQGVLEFGLGDEDLLRCGKPEGFGELEGSVDLLPGLRHLLENGLWFLHDLNRTRSEAEK